MNIHSTKCIWKWRLLNGGHLVSVSMCQHIWWHHYTLYSINFPGDMGGFMGLLLGASVMTICELLDLMIYNCFRKLRNRRRVNSKGVTAWAIPTEKSKCLMEKLYIYIYIYICDYYVYQLPYLIMITRQSVHYTFHYLYYLITTSLSRVNVWYLHKFMYHNKLVDNSDIVEVSPVGAAPTTSSFST